MGPFQWALAWVQTAAAGVALAIDAQNVATMGLMGLAGLRRVPKDEALRMVFEKPPVFGAAGVAWQEALFEGRDWTGQARAAARPLARKTRASRRLLSRRR